jgi:hypothetical protein
MGCIGHAQARVCSELCVWWDALDMRKREGVESCVCGGVHSTVVSRIPWCISLVGRQASRRLQYVLH